MNTNNIVNSIFTPFIWKFQYQEEKMHLNVVEGGKYWERDITSEYMTAVLHLENLGRQSNWINTISS